MQVQLDGKKVARERAEGRVEGREGVDDGGNAEIVDLERERRR